MHRALLRNTICLLIFAVSCIFIVIIKPDILNYRESPIDEEKRLLKIITDGQDKQLSALMSQKTDAKNHFNISNKAWKLPIPVLVFVCSRANATYDHIKKLMKFRPSVPEHPIVVSQDCNHSEVSKVIKGFGSSIIHIAHSIKTPRLRGKESRFAIYYRIAMHYYLGLKYIFEEQNHTSVIITEDDLDIAPDFFDYFDAMRWLLEADKTLFCISAWNDNGKDFLIDHSANELLYRTDFFPGLGWMLTREFWNEIKDKWPRAYWDDWLRESAQRKDRACVRPEISRTVITPYGKLGASGGLFFNRHLKKIVLNKVPASFSEQNIGYLLKENYDNAFLEMVYSLPKLNLDEIIVRPKQFPNSGSFRIEYETMDDYLHAAKVLGIMADTKAGIPRTAYRGIVSCFIRGTRVFVAPNKTNWNGYDVKWEAPPDILDSH